MTVGRFWMQPRVQPHITRPAGWCFWTFCIFRKIFGMLGWLAFFGGLVQPPTSETYFVFSCAIVMLGAKEKYGKAAEMAADSNGSRFISSNEAAGRQTGRSVQHVPECKLQIRGSEPQLSWAAVHHELMNLVHSQEFINFCLRLGTPIPRVMTIYQLENHVSERAQSKTCRWFSSG